MLRREFLSTSLAAVGAAVLPSASMGERFAAAARAQLGVTTTYDPRYTRLAYPNGDVPRATGVCADVIVRAGRDGLGLDLQKLVHEDMLRDFAAYPKTWGMAHTDASIDHRRVLNLEAFWRRSHAQVWAASSATAGNAFPGTLQVGDVLTWLLNARLPHVGVVVSNAVLGPRVVHNWGRGAEESSLLIFAPHRAKGHFRWPAA